MTNLELGNKAAAIAIDGRSVGSRERWLVTTICIFLAWITWLVFGQTLRHDFVNFDDNIFVYENSHIQDGITWSTVRWTFSAGVNGDAANADYWRPLSFLSHALDIQLFGLRPGGHHLTNVVIHIAATLALFLVLQTMTGAMWRSAFVAALFAIHPLHVESVAWVTERKDVLSGLFFMLTLGAYVRYARRPFSFGRYLTVFFLFLLALMCKPMVVTLPCVLLLLDYWPLGRLNSWAQFRRLFLEKIPFFALAAALAFVTTLGPGSTESKEMEPLSLYARLGNALVSYAVYLGQMIYPTKLAVLYPHPGNNLPFREVTLAGLLLLFISGAVFLWRKKYPFLLVGWLWFLGMLVPVIGLVQVGLQSHADRYTYLPQVGISLAIVWAGAEIFATRRNSRNLLSGFALAVIMALAVCARVQSSYWRDSETLWKHAIACTHANHLAYDNLGNVFLERGRVDDAIKQFYKGLEIKPNSPETHNNLSAALMRKGKLDEAVAHYLKAIEIKPGYAEGHNNLGAALMRKGQAREAVAHYQEAIKIKPDLAPAHNNLGGALFQQGQVDEAIAEYRKALAIDPSYAEAHHNIAGAFLQKRQNGEALAHYQKAREIQTYFEQAHIPGDAFRQKQQLNRIIARYLKALELNRDDAEAHNNLGNALREAGYLGEAIIHYLKAIEISPNLAEAHNGLANTLLQRGRVDDAVVQYNQAIEIKPDLAEAHSNLGNALLQRGEAKEAIAHCEKAIELKPLNVSFQNNLAFVLATSPDVTVRNGARAVQLAEQANQLSGGNQPDILGTLAAAYAEAGRFSDAVETAQKALQSAKRQGNTGLRDRIESDLKLYQGKSPLRAPNLTDGKPQ